ncbi:leucyl aminopeptidase [Patescibacteria group bacterium]|nr:leucyl aminopeptidase [Patescibacteria group bacterium]
MKLNVYCDKLEDLKCDAVVVFVEKDRVALRGLEAEVNKMVDNKVGEMLESKEFESKPDQFMYFHTFDKIKNIPRVALVGYSLEDDITLNSLRSSAAKVAKSLRNVGMKKIAMIMPNVRAWFMPDSARVIVEGALMGLYRFDKYVEKKYTKKLEEIVLVGEGKDRRTLEKAILLGEMEASGVMLARDVANEPGNVLTPKHFAGIAKRMMQKVKVGCNVLDEGDIKKEGLGLLYGVGKGSENPPQMVVMNYNAGKKYPTVAVVGKGITFDSGGVDLKVGTAAGPMFFNMKRDMAGAAAVLGMMYVVGQIKPKINIIGVLPLAENMPDGRSYKPGDILVSYSGKSVEIFQTDAEGRLVMADAMSYVQENYAVDYLLDVATLTGSAVLTCGPKMMGLFGNDSRLLERIKKAGVVAGEETMDFPLYDGYRQRIKSHFADIKNFSYKPPYMIASALFLREFVKEGTKWAHLDIASMVSSSGEGTYLTRGATGAGVRLLSHLVLGMGK